MSNSLLQPGLYQFKQVAHITDVANHQRETCKKGDVVLLFNSEYDAARKELFFQVLTPSGKQFRTCFGYADNEELVKRCLEVMEVVQP